MATNKLQFGCFNVKLTNTDGSSETVLCKPLTQSEYADGWQCVLPQRTRKSDLHNWNVSLAQLPPHLWSKCRTYYNDDGKECYRKINDNIYVYNVVKTDYDDMMHELHSHLHQANPNKNAIRTLVNELKDNVSGWLLTRANIVLATNHHLAC